MRRWVLSVLVLLLFTLTAMSRMIAPPTIPARVAVVDRVVVGKVIKLSDKLVPSEMFKDDKRSMQLATVQVSEAILGSKTNEIQVGYFPPTAPQPGLPIRRVTVIELNVGDEALFYLTAHPSKKGVYLISNYYDISKKTGHRNFSLEVEEAKKAAKLLTNPRAALEGKDPAAQELAAMMLLTRYRTDRPGSKTEPISADESKRLLTALAQADWSSSRDRQLNPIAVFARLGLTDKDGWTPPINFDDFGREAKRWLQANADKYRVQRFVWPGSDAVSPEPE